MADTDRHETKGQVPQADDRRTDADALRLSEERYRALVEATSHAIWTWSDDGTNTDVARTQAWWEDLTGQSVAEQRTDRNAWFDVVHPDDRPAAEAAWTAAMAAGTNYDAEYRVRSRAGGWRHVHTRGVPVRRPDGTVREWVGSLNDVTDRRRAELELRQTESRFRRLASAGIIGIIQWNLDAGLIVDANDEFLRMTGYDREDVAAGRLDFRRMTPPEWTPRNESGILDIRRKGVGGAYEKEYFRKDGSRVPIIIVGVRFEDSTNEGMSFVLDITERKRAEEALARVVAESEKRRRMFDTALSNTADFVYLFDLEGRFTYMNKALLDLWQKDFAGAVGKDFFELDYPPDLAARLRQQIRTVIATRTPLRDETPYTSAAGTRAYEYIFVPVFAADGSVEAVAGSTRDVTDRKLAEQALREADRKKDDFIALLAHELRNPLAPIRNGLEVVRLSQDRAVRERSQAMMERQLAHMVRLIDDLLDVSRISRNKMELRRARISLADVIASALETARPAVDAAAHELTVVLPARPVFLDADLTRLSQVFSNLLCNSAKYTERGGRIRLTAEVRDGAVAVTITDTGIGIPCEALPTIFDMFSQVDRSVERSTGGLGIGLALVKGLVEMHGGSVAARSDGPGRGSAFVVTLPVAPAERVSTGGDSPGDPRGPSVRGRRILVVDDSRDGADSLATMLELLGNEIDRAYDGLEAVDRADRFRPDLILMDVGMPKLNGLDATGRIRGTAWGCGATIIALTGWGQDADRERSLRAGCDGHLVKPVNLAELEQLLSDLSAGKKG